MCFKQFESVGTRAPVQFGIVASEVQDCRARASGHDTGDTSTYGRSS